MFFFFFYNTADLRFHLCLAANIDLREIPEYSCYVVQDIVSAQIQLLPNPVSEIQHTHH